jgi:hypothetical protein
MLLTRLCVLALLLSNGVSVATEQNSIRLRFEIYRNSSVIGNPEVSVMSDGNGRIDIKGVEAIAFTPTLRKSDAVAIAFDIDSGSRHLNPVIVIGHSGRGSASWTSSTGDAFRLTVRWVR